MGDVDVCTPLEISFGKEWIEEKRKILGYPITFYICPYCGYEPCEKYNFCPECGKDLRGGGEDGDE